MESNSALLIVVSEKLLALSRPVSNMFNFLRKVNFAADTYSDSILKNPAHMVQIKRKNAYPTFVVAFVVRNGNYSIRSDLTLIVDLKSTYNDCLRMLNNAYATIFEQPSQSILAEIMQITQQEQQVLGANHPYPMFTTMEDEEAEGSCGYGNIVIS